MTWPKLVRDWEGKKVCSKAPLANLCFRYPAGTVFTIVASYCVLHLKTKPCPACGIEGYITIKGTQKHKMSLFDYLG